MDYSNLFVCLMGMGTVFFGLICIVALTTLLSAVCRAGQKPVSIPAPAVPAPAPAQTVSPELIAAVSAAVAEDLGADISGIRILSVKKL